MDFAWIFAIFLNSIYTLTNRLYENAKKFVKVHAKSMSFWQKCKKLLDFYYFKFNIVENGNWIFKINSNAFSKNENAFAKFMEMHFQNLEMHLQNSEMHLQNSWKCIFKNWKSICKIHEMRLQNSWKCICKIHENSFAKSTIFYLNL